MALRYFTRETDPFQTVYEVDFDRGTWRIFGSDESLPYSRGLLADGGAAFLSVHFARLTLVMEWDDGASFVRAVSSTMH